MWERSVVEVDVEAMAGGESLELRCGAVLNSSVGVEAHNWHSGIAYLVAKFCGNFPGRSIMWIHICTSGRRLSAVVVTEGQQRRRGRRSDIPTLKIRTPLTVWKPCKVISMNEESLRVSNIG